jgi:hypothetical protein
MVCVKGGYKTITPIQIANCLWANLEKRIAYRAVRVYFACLAMVAVREAAARSQKKKGRAARSEACFQIVEIARVSGLTEKVVNRELRALKREGVLTWSEKAIDANNRPIEGSEALSQLLSGKRSPRRPIPVPRSILRFLASTPQASIGKTTVAYIVRGLTIDRRTAEIGSAGTVKASWISDTLEVSLRAVKSARKMLIDSGFIAKDTSSFQRKLNRTGAYFRVDLSWSNGKSGKAKTAPPTLQKGAEFAPPYKYKKTSYEFKNQKTQMRVFKTPGVCKANGKEEPNLRDIRRDDLKLYPRLKKLFFQAAKAGWVKPSEANFLNWVGAAIRANSVNARDPVRVFVSITKRGNWNLISQRQEERARAAIRFYRENETEFASETNAD